MVAWLGPALSAGGAIAGGLMQSKNQKTANDIAALNYYEQQHANQEKQRLAEAALKRQDEGVTTGSGTRSQYIPGQGYVTTLSPLEQAISSGLLKQNAESATSGVLRRKELEDRGYEQQLAASGEVDNLLRELTGPRSMTRSGIESELRLADRQGTSEQNNALIEALAEKASRQGGLQNNQALMRAMSGGLNNTFKSKRPYGLEADELYRNREASNSSNKVNLINALKGVASPGGVPMPAQFNADQTTMGMQARAPSAYGMAIGSVGAPQMGESKGSYALSNVLNSMGSAAYGYNQYQDAKDQQNQLMMALAGRQVNHGAGNPGR